VWGTCALYDDCSRAYTVHHYLNQILDLRSELVRQACVTISAMATELGMNFKKMAHKLMKCLLDVAGSRNTVIRGMFVDHCAYVHDRDDVSHPVCLHTAL